VALNVLRPQLQVRKRRDLRMIAVKRLPKPGDSALYVFRVSTPNVCVNQLFTVNVHCLITGRSDLAARIVH